jgi:hypothetical protein
MALSIEEKHNHEIILHQTITHRRSVERSIAFSQEPNGPLRVLFTPPEVDPEIKQISNKLQRHVFFNNHWWSAVHSDKGLLINFFV